MKSNCKKATLFLLFIFIFLSCAPRKRIVYMQDIDTIGADNKSLSFEPKLQIDDKLSVTVSAETPELTVPFNVPQIQSNYDLVRNQDNIKSYLIDNSGYIDFPVIGKIKLAGLTKSEANEVIQKKVAEYIQNPTININILNYKVSVLGEVNKPNSYMIGGERVTILEAISLAGDLTIYGKRNNVLLIRELDGKKSFNRIDLTKSDFINSPFYYLSQNDVVFVEPNKTKINGSVIGPNVSIIVTGLSLLASVIIIFLRK